MYPDKFIKGIPNNSFIGEDDLPTSDLFYFQEQHQKKNRVDNFLEESISWRDDEGADTLLFNQMKNGSYQFNAGIAIMCRKEFDKLKKLPHLQEILNYEREELPENKYHGNLILKNTVKKRKMKEIAAIIANICFLEIIKNPHI